MEHVDVTAMALESASASARAPPKTTRLSPGEPASDRVSLTERRSPLPSFRRIGPFLSSGAQRCNF
eukprot:8925389-Pyramimonas_sp.AAC.1